MSSPSIIEPLFNNVHLTGSPRDSRWNIFCTDGHIKSKLECSPPTSNQETNCCLLAPSLCHPHIHLDKCFLLSHPKYTDLKVVDGDFAEAIRLTNAAKSRFDHEDLMERGRALVEESIGFGVTHMRAFVEVDQGVGLKCLQAGLALKEEFQDRCYVQICVFAQDPIFSHEDGGESMKRLIEQAAERPGVEALGSTPYVERNGDPKVQIKNVEWTIAMAKKLKLHVDFHVDYNLSFDERSIIPEVISILHSSGWPSDPDSHDFRTIVFGHCTRLTLFTDEEWLHLRAQIRGLPISFVGLPTSDLFMMGRPTKGSCGGHRARGTLQIPQMIRKYGLKAAIGINNVGNAFTPHGSCDPLSLTSFGVGLYHAGTEGDAEILLVSASVGKNSVNGKNLQQCVSSRAKRAIGATPSIAFETDFAVGNSADFVAFGSNSVNGPKSFRSRTSTQDLVYDAGYDRTTIFRGQVVSSCHT